MGNVHDIWANNVRLCSVTPLGVSCVTAPSRGLAYRDHRVRGRCVILGLGDRRVREQFRRLLELESRFVRSVHTLVKTDT